MRIYKRAEFLKLPTGTFYHQAYQPWAWQALQIKGETLWHDWTGVDPVHDWVSLSFDNPDANSSEQLDERLDEMLENGASYPMNESGGRDGCFERNAIFLVYEEADLFKLRGYVDEAIAITPPSNPQATS